MKAGLRACLIAWQESDVLQSDRARISKEAVLSGIERAASGLNAKGAGVERV